MANEIKGYNPSNVYDVSPEERRAVSERAAIRRAFKKEWQRKVTYPFRGVGGYVFDPAVQRWMSMRASQYDYFKATPKTTLIAVTFLVLPFVTTMYFGWLETTNREIRFRKGEVPYKDRLWKFV